MDLDYFHNLTAFVLKWQYVDTVNCQAVRQTATCVVFWRKSEVWPLGRHWMTSMSLFWLWKVGTFWSVAVLTSFVCTKLQKIKSADILIFCSFVAHANLQHYNFIESVNVTSLSRTEDQATVCFDWERAWRKSGLHTYPGTRPLGNGCGSCFQGTHVGGLRWCDVTPRFARLPFLGLRNVRVWIWRQFSCVTCVAVSSDPPAWQPVLPNMENLKVV